MGRDCDVQRSAMTRMTGVDAVSEPFAESFGNESVPKTYRRVPSANCPYTDRPSRVCKRGGLQGVRWGSRGGGA